MPSFSQKVYEVVRKIPKGEVLSCLGYTMVIQLFQHSAECWNNVMEISSFKIPEL